jgi:hypothetical protein
MYSQQRKGWRGDSYRHALARAGVRTSPRRRTPKYELDINKLKFRRRGKIYEVDLKAEPSEDERIKREIARLHKMSLTEIKRKYKNVEEG